jgi:CubicO group peptidase (beta-lactamase class C family)
MESRMLKLGLVVFLITALSGCVWAGEMYGSNEVEVTATADSPGTSLPEQAGYWPTAGWQTADPGEVGMDAAQIDRMMEAIDEAGIDLHSVIVVHDGFIVAERYFTPFDQQDLHESYSITKSVVSALVGIAIERGHLESVDQVVLDFFPGYEFENGSAEKQAITLEHLLTMSSGLEEDFNAMTSSADWVQATLDQPMRSSPGKEFLYNNGNAHVLSAILQKSTGGDLIAFARQHLFSPLGIEELRWQTDLNSIPKGGWGLSLTPRDLAKIGYLYLNKGEWEGKQIVPGEWIEASTRPYIQVPDPKEPWDLHMGYLWWLHGDGPYAAHGVKGQFVYIVDEHNLVVVFTAGLPDADFVKPQMLIRDYIIPALSGVD